MTKITLALEKPANLKQIENWLITARDAGFGDENEVTVSFGDITVTGDVSE